MYVKFAFIFHEVQGRQGSYDFAGAEEVVIEIGAGGCLFMTMTLVHVPTEWFLMVVALGAHGNHVAVRSW